MNDLAETVRASMAGVPDLGYKPVPDVFKLPPGMNFGPCSGVAVNSKGNILVFNRSAHALMEFDGKGKFLRYARRRGSSPSRTGCAWTKTTTSG